MLPKVSSESDAIRTRRDPLPYAVWGVAAVLVGAALLVDPPRLWPAARATAGSFLTLGVLIAGGVLVDRMGLFRLLARLLISSRASPRVAFAAVLLFTAILSGAINLDVAVVVAIPVALRVARQAHLSASHLCLATALTANAASFLLPTSNLTTLLILSRASMSASEYLRQSWAAWLLVCGLTVCGLTLALARPGLSGRDSADRKMKPRALLDLAPLYLCASAIRALLGVGLVFPGRFAGQLTAGVVFAAAANNLPAAAAVHPSGPTGTWAMVLAMAIGPNLLVTGSIATIICRRIARDDGVSFGIATFSLLGLAFVPLEVAAAVAGLFVTGALH
jgi:Na+/H+ antiporter NhaD/arsenite permease-like protein